MIVGARVLIEQNELVTLLVGLSVVIFVLGNRRGLKALPEAKVCILAFASLVMGLTFTVLEGLFWEASLNLLEHISYAASSLLLAGWIWLVFARRESWPGA